MRELQGCSSFAEVLQAVYELVPELIGRGDCAVVDCQMDGGLIEVPGRGEGAQFVEKHSPELQDAITGLNLEMGEVTEVTACADVLFGPKGGTAWLGQLVVGEYRRSSLLLFVDKQVFNSDEIERFQALVYYISCALRGIAARVYDNCVRRQVIRFRAQFPPAFFLYSPSGELTPLNHPAVMHAQKYWDEDEAVKVLGDRAHQQLRQILFSAWDSPVEPRWAQAHFDLGSGDMPLYVVPKIMGEALLALQTRPPSQALAGVSDMLTKRQAEIMEWIAEGKTSNEVATILSISPRTVEKHLEAIFQRLGVENRIAASRRFLELKGLIGS